MMHLWESNHRFTAENAERAEKSGKEKEGTPMDTDKS